MKVLKIVGGIILSLVVIFFLLALIGPSGYKITRSIEISAPVDVVFNQTSKFANWAAWSPWAKLDANAKYVIENDNQEVGASMGWEGDPELVGTGKMTATKVEKNKEFLYDLTFLVPWEMTSHGGFLYEKGEKGVQLTWYDEGEFPFMSRPMMLFMDMEEQIGPSFEQGLADIKKVCEEMETAPAIEITEEMVESVPILYIEESSSLMPNEISAKMGEAYGEIMALMGVAKLEKAAAPRAITTKYSMEEMVCDFNPAIPVVEIPQELELSGRIQKAASYAGKASKTVHTGNYMNLKVTYDAMLKHIEEKGYEINGNSWEEYIDNPEEVEEENRRTNIYFPVK